MSSLFSQWELQGRPPFIKKMAPDRTFRQFFEEFSTAVGWSLGALNAIISAHKEGKEPDWELAESMFLNSKAIVDKACKRLGMEPFMPTDTTTEREE